MKILFIKYGNRCSSLIRVHKKHKIKQNTKIREKKSREKYNTI